MILANPFQREIEELGKDYSKAFERVMRSGWYILGNEVEAFEKEFAAYLGSRFGIGCASGLDALILSLKALGIGPGDEIITTPLSAAATALAISHIGATPVFADVLPETLALDPQKAAKKITPRTKAIIPVHLYGHSAETGAFDELCAKHGLALIEDCAQSAGARDASGRMTGTRGVTGCFSFYPTKNLGAFGDAGFICTNDPKIAESLRKWRHYGQRARYDHELPGYNSRLDEVHAAILREKLKHLDRWNERRREMATAYNQSLGKIWKLPLSSRSVFHLYPIQVDHRDALLNGLKAAGIEGAVHYPTLIPEQECYKESNYGASESLWPIAFQASRRLVSLPVNPYLTDSEIDQISSVLSDLIG
jgi:dTDP-4-amino-4,6-dideoxygalactose transaminase